MACQCPHFGADRTFGKSGLLYDFIQRKRGGRKIQHGKNRAHAFWKTPEAADLAEAFRGFSRRPKLLP